MRWTGRHLTGHTEGLLMLIPSEPLTYSQASLPAPPRVARAQAGSSAGIDRTGPGGVSAVSNRTVTTPCPSPDPAAAVLVVDDVHARRPHRPAAGRASTSAVASSAGASSSSSPNRSSWIQSASPETPTPSRRTPSLVSSSDSSERASRAMSRRGRWGGQRGRPVEGREVVEPDLDGDRAPDRPCLRSRWRPGPPAGSAVPPSAGGRSGRCRTCPRRDRLGLALGIDGAVVAGTGQRVQAGAVGTAQQPHQLL